MVRIEIVDDLEKRMRETDKYVEDVLAGKRKISKAMAERTIITTPEIFSKLFSPERIRLLLEIRRSKSRNIYQIAKFLGRSYEAVHRDIKLLEGYGIVKVRTSDRKRYPYMEPIQMNMFAKA